jgi:hypothetical protein
MLACSQSESHNYSLPFRACRASYCDFCLTLFALCLALLDLLAHTNLQTTQHFAKPRRQPRAQQNMPSQTTSIHDAASTILELAFSTVTITTTPPRLSHSTQSTNLAILTAIATSKNTPTTHTTTYGTVPKALQSMATALATTTVPSTIATPLAKPLLEPHPNIVPDWPPALVIFLLSWLAMAWVVTVVLFLASFPEKVAWLDRRIERLREWRWRNQYVKQERSSEGHGHGGLDGLIILQGYSTPIRGLYTQRHGFSHLGAACR